MLYDMSYNCGHIPLYCLKNKLKIIKIKIKSKKIDKRKIKEK